MEQALARSGGDKRDQGKSAAHAVMRMALLRHALGGIEAPLPSPVAWPRSATAAARGPRSGTPGATRWSPRGVASTRTSRRSGSTTAGRPRRVYVCTRCLKSNKVDQGRVAVRRDNPGPSDGRHLHRALSPGRPGRLGATCIAPAGGQRPQRLPGRRRRHRRQHGADDAGGDEGARPPRRPADPGRPRRARARGRPRGAAWARAGTPASS